MRRIIRISTVCGVVALLIGILFVTSMIPTERIRDNSIDSAKFLHEKGRYYHLNEKWENTLLHYYADEISLNIAYHIDPDSPVKSSLKSAFYDVDDMQVDECLYKSVVKDLPANKEYMRYWHGYLIFVRPLLTIMNIRGIYLLFSVILLLLFVALCSLLLREGCKSEVVLLLIAAVATNAFIVGMCLEYLWCFLWMLVFSIIVILLEKKESEEWLPCIFAISGVVTIFFDFFTNETLTLTVPLLLLMLWRRKKKPLGREDGSFCLKCGLTWVAGYVCMWALKWMLSMIVFGIAPADFLLSYLQKWSVGEPGSPVKKFAPLSAIIQNIRHLIPAVIPHAGGVILGVLIFVLAYKLYVHHNSEHDHVLVKLLLLIGLIPYLRYLVLSPHSNLHAFFTFRAQFVTIVAIGAVYIETTRKKTIAKKEIVNNNISNKKKVGGKKRK